MLKFESLLRQKTRSSTLRYLAIWSVHCHLPNIEFSHRSYRKIRFCHFDGSHSCQSMSEYSYIPLKNDEIRLLYIDAGETTDPLMCTFHHCVLPPQNIPFTFKYTALSYHWSTEVSMHPINLHGHNFLIPNNLAVALRRLRRKTGGGTISMWVDALCINQADLAEKSLQVVRMRAIYEGASRVLCWLGDEDDQSRIACKKLTELSTILPTEILSRDPSMSLLAQNIPVLHSHLSEKDWVALKSFFMNPWWNRVW